MKFAACLIAIGASAIKLRQEDDGPALADRGDRVQRIIDWDGDGVIQLHEAMDQVFLFNALGYIDDETTDLIINDYSENMPDEFTFEEVHEEALENDDVADLEWFIEYSEDVFIDIATNAIFDEVDANGNGDIDESEGEAVLEGLCEGDSGCEQEVGEVAAMIDAEGNGDGTIQKNEVLEFTAMMINSDDELREMAMD